MKEYQKYCDKQDHQKPTGRKNRTRYKTQNFKKSYMMNLTLKEKKITQLEVKKAILNMKNNKSEDRSTWKAESLKQGGGEMIESLTTIFNRVEEDG